MAASLRQGVHLTSSLTSSAFSRRFVASWIHKCNQSNKHYQKLDIDKVFIRPEVQHLLNAIVTNDTDPTRVFHRESDHYEEPLADKMLIMSQEEMDEVGLL